MYCTVVIDPHFIPVVSLCEALDYLHRGIIVCGIFKGPNQGTSHHSGFAVERSVDIIQ
jgi:hypothetical protein